MSSQLRWKFIFILIVILLCLFGLVGLPQFPTSWAQAKQNFSDRLRLGLDLKGGSHLVLQVHLAEAIGQRCDQAIDDLKKQLHEKNVVVGDVQRLSDTQILVRGVDPTTSGNVPGRRHKPIHGLGDGARRGRAERLSAYDQALGACRLATQHDGPVTRNH